LKKKIKKYISSTFFSVLGIFNQKDLKKYFDLGPIMLDEHDSYGPKIVFFKY